MKSLSRVAVCPVLMVLFGLGLFWAKPVQAAEQSATGWKDIVVAPVFNWFEVDGDKGRFRQDWRVNDDFSGGFEQVSATTADEKTSLETYAVSENEYGHTLKVKLSEDRTLEIRGKYFRQYYDGSNEPWDAGLYSLPAEYADFEDDDLYADRLRETIDYRRAIDEKTEIGFGYDLWGRFGRERLLRGEQSTGSAVNRRSIPARTYLEGLSHTFYGEYKRLLFGKYNFNVRPSFEIYQDQQDSQFYRYVSGALSQARTFLDSPKFMDFNLTATLDTFVNDDTYFFTGYLFNFLKNETVRSEVRPAGASTFTDPSLDNVRISNAGNLGTVLLNFLGVKDLRFHASTRGEIADTNSRGFGTTGSATRGNFGHKESRSDIDEYWLSESLGLNYKGFADTNIDLMVDLDQRHFDYDEYTDIASYEAFVDFGASTRFFEYNSDIFYNDLKTTWRASHRFNSHLKGSATYKFKYQDHDYDTNEDTELVFYPGVIGDIVREVHDIGVGLDIWWLESWSSSIKYQQIGDDIHTQLGGPEVQNLNKNRVILTLLGQPVKRVTFFSSLSYENNDLETPTNVVPTSTWGVGTDPYDFHGDYLIYNVSTTWQANDKTKIYGRYQQTNSFGSFQGVQENVLYEIHTGVTQKLWTSSSLKGEFFYFDFNDKNDIVRGFDNYDGYGLVLSYSQKL